MLGHLYCAEALTMLDRIAEARTYLEPKFIAELKEDDFVHRGSPGNFCRFLPFCPKLNVTVNMIYSCVHNRLEYKYIRCSTINIKI